MTEQTQETGRALAVTQPARMRRSVGGRPEAAHLAHLLAMRHDAEQFRLKRRAAPGEAVGAYGAAAGRKAPVRPEFDGRV